MKSEADRAALVARREALKARLEQERKLALIQPLIDVLNERGVIYTVQSDPTQGTLPGWPCVGTQIDWSSVPGATYIEVAADSRRDAAFRSLLSQFSSKEDCVDVIPANGDAPIVSILSSDLGASCGPILSTDISLYIAPPDCSWLIENLEGRGLWSGVAPG